MRVAVITPYYKEPRDWLERCIASVRTQTHACEHLLVADGHPQDWIDATGLRHLRLDRSHRDYGNTPRSLGAQLLVSEGVDAIAFLDVDNAFAPGHVAACVALAARTGSDYVTAQRRFVRKDGSVLPFRSAEDDAGQHVDTSCLFLTRTAFHTLPRWLLMPKPMSILGDRYILASLREEGLASARLQVPTVDYQCGFSDVYRAVGETPPPFAKEGLPLDELAEWIDGLGERDLLQIRRLAGCLPSMSVLNAPAKPSARPVATFSASKGSSVLTLSPIRQSGADPAARTSVPASAADVPATPRAASVNLVLLTVRHNLLAREIIDAAMRATVAYPGVRLSLAYGGDDAAHQEWLAAQCAAAQAQGGDVRLMQHPDIQLRLQWALASPQDWLLFLSDDDAFGVNYIGSLVRRASTVGPEVAIVAPMLYLGVTAGRTMTRRVEPVGGPVADRLAKFEARADLKAVLYYAMHRRDTVKASFEQLATMPHTPSYFDQLLTTRSILQGELAVTDEPSMQVRDESNWEDLDACTRSNARFYPEPTMVLFHELLWTADMIRLFRSHPEFGALQDGLKQWMRTMLTHQAGTFERRCAVLGIVADGEVAEMLRAVVTVVEWLHRVTPGEAFAAGLSSVEALAAEIQRTLLERAGAANASGPTRQLAREELPA